MPTEFFEKDGVVSRDWLEGPEHELIYSTYQHMGGLIVEGLIDYLIYGRPELSVLERGTGGGLEQYVANPHYPGTIGSRLIATPHGTARLVVSYHEMPEYKRGFAQVITISDSVPAARYIGILMHNITLLINDSEGIEEFREDDTPEHIPLETIAGMIRWYGQDMLEYHKRKHAGQN